MLQEIKDLQNSAVSQLVTLVSARRKKEFTFRAPTGSGKTYMMADFMNRILGSRNDIVFLVSSLSKSELAEQNYNSFCDLSYRGIFPHLNPYLINSEQSSEGALHIPIDCNVYVLPRDLYKKKSKLKDEGTFLNFLETIKGNANLFEGRAGRAGKEIFVIKDECHIATKNLDELDQFFSMVINFSATPKLSKGQLPDVEITNAEAEEVRLIKQVKFFDNTASLDSLEKKNADLDAALDEFERVRKDYINQLEVSPCFIIQISNKDKALEELNKTILPVLANNKHQELKWAYITGDKSGKGCNTNDAGLKKLPISKWKEFMKPKESSISVIIFKMVISEGWDIPRACMLYQIRDTQSKQLDEQVMGRVRRNPRLLDFERLEKEAQDLASTAWVWGIKPQDMLLPKSVRLVRDFDIKAKIRVSPTRLRVEKVKAKVDVEELLKGRKNRQVKKSIFEIYRQLLKYENEIQDLCYDYADSYQKWYHFMENIDDIKKKYHSVVTDYDNSMEKCPAVSFPDSSCYNKTDKSLTSEDWVWVLKEGDDESSDFSFDSEAEKKWAEVLKDIRKESIQKITNIHNSEQKFLWGKNFPLNSEIKFEYFLDGIHSSYPDFIMKDTKGRIHVFEVKSVNKSSTFKIDQEAYESKIEAIKESYKASSKLTTHIFYLPVLDGNTWQISRFKNGEEDTITKQMFEDSLK